MIIAYSGNTITWNKNSEQRIIISLTYDIVCFAINENYIAVIEDWQYLEGEENLYIYNTMGKLLFKVKEAPNAFSGKGYYTSVGFKSDYILGAHTFDYKYEIDLRTNEFINETYTK
ncbi:MAG: hypothetical protein HOO91_06290 [Bacteroidales bacterium]|nr:hypothetical protein [Bacteroidales bacterium]